MLQEKQEHRQRAEHIELLLQKVAALADQQASATIEGTRSSTAGHVWSRADTHT